MEELVFRLVIKEFTLTKLAVPHLKADGVESWNRRLPLTDPEHRCLLRIPDSWTSTISMVNDQVQEPTTSCGDYRSQQPQSAFPSPGV